MRRKKTFPDMIQKRLCFQVPEGVHSAEQSSEQPKQPKAPETAEALRARITAEVKNQVSKETGLVDKLQTDPSTTAKEIELKVLQSLSDVAYAQEPGHEALNKGYIDLQAEVHAQVQKSLQIPA